MHLLDVRQLEDVREDVEAWGLQQRADSLGQGRARQRQELLHLHLGPEGDTVVRDTTQQVTHWLNRPPPFVDQRGTQGHTK